MRLAAVMFFAAAAAALAGCGYYGNDEGVRYLQRKDTVTLSAGDASRANAVAQTIHPWPPGVGNRKIPMEGSRAVRAIECYRQGSGQELVSDQRGRAPSRTQHKRWRFRRVRRRRRQRRRREEPATS